MCIQGAKYRGLDGEDNEYRLYKHCGCMLKLITSDYISQVAQRKLTHTADQKQETNFVWPKYNVDYCQIVKMFSLCKSIIQ